MKAAHFFRFFFILFGTLFFIPKILYAYTFSSNLHIGSVGQDVRALQISLNQDPSTKIAATGPGSPGNETMYFGSLTMRAVVRFQEKYRGEILEPIGLSQGTGYVGAITRTKLNIITSAPPPTPPNTPLSTSSAEKEEPQIFSFSPTSGPVGTKVTLRGKGFTKTGNTVFTGYTTLQNVPSPDGATITFELPMPHLLFQGLAPGAPQPTLTPKTKKIHPIQYWFYVKNENGVNHNPQDAFLMTF
jgi:peptidoglycan hydrolase-like protein with peptidoglycan-binding domain